MGKPVMSKATFFKYIEKLEIAIRTRLEERELDVYYAHLKSLPEDVLSKRVGELILSNKFFPKVSEIWNGYAGPAREPLSQEQEQKRFEDVFK